MGEAEPRIKYALIGIQAPNMKSRMKAAMVFCGSPIQKRRLAMKRKRIPTEKSPRMRIPSVIRVRVT
jgi:hypothetical protein